MNTATLSPETLPAIIWNNQPVITTELLANIYGAKEIQIQQNFNNNASRFIEGIHYFIIKGTDLKELKLYLDKIEVQISNMVRKLYLWTERGTVRHAKILDTDNAWLVQDQLEEFYFTKNTPVPYGLKDTPTERLPLKKPSSHCLVVYPLKRKTSLRSSLMTVQRCYPKTSKPRRLSQCGVH
ncbi:ORF6N domain-containing protein [Methylocucumis oryzae]|uniref:ORF6N domain-containing protein n=1 Tax=Methylocucumis oryzae TaxID=1632867 RepID=UPI000695BE2C|nr:ORF6N domain-containing protein [Methylocucumis oryzae]